MKKIRVLRNVIAHGKVLNAGRTYKVPDEVSETDAKVLLEIGKAVVEDKDKKGGNEGK